MGRISLPAVFAISVAASVVADLAWYLAGRRYGYPVLKFLCRVSLSPDTCVRQTEGIFERWGFYSLVVSKFVPGFSTVAPPIAGALKMSAGKFLLAALASAALWVGAAMGAGLLFAREVEVVLGWMARNAGLAAAVVGAALALYIAYRAWQRWQLARFVHAARISVDELHERLQGDAKPMVVDIGSEARAAVAPAHSRREVHGSRRRRPQCGRVPDRPRDRLLLQLPERRVGEARRADPAGKGLHAGPAAGRRASTPWVAAGRAVEHGIPATFIRKPVGAD